MNPILSLADLLRRLHEELERAPSLAVRWQRQEARINVYLFACAIACTVDDHLARRRGNLARYAARFPRLRVLVALVQGCLQLAQTLHKLIADRPIRGWRRQWDRCVDLSCEILIEETDPGDAKWSELRASCETLSVANLPARLRRRRMPLPTAFRNHDLSHHDVCSLADRFVAASPAAARDVVVLGARTAGSYFAPLIKAALTRRGWSHVSWLTIRPKGPLSRWERQRLRTLLGADSRVLLVDEFPRSGVTLRLLLDLVGQFVADPARVTILVPQPRAHPGWVLPGAGPVGLVMLAPEELFKARQLALRSTAAIRQYYQERGWEDAQVQASDAVAEINQGFAEQYRDQRYARLKQVFQVRLSASQRGPVIRHVLAKSVGWGWLGYHAYVAGTELGGFVPPVLGLRDGLLWTEWVGRAHGNSTLATTRLGPAEAPALPALLGAYVARRVRRLPLNEDPCLEEPDYDSNGWTVLLQMCLGAYGPVVGRLKLPTLWRRLRRYASPRPTLIDGRIGPHEWTATEGAIVKTDFEHHNFGGAEMNVVDPAYDLAAAIFEFGFSDQQARDLLRSYAGASGDPGIFARLFLYKLLYGTVAMRSALQLLAQSPSGGLNQRYHAARNFLVYELHRHCAGRLPSPSHPTWRGHLFFLDLDGVFDCDVLGFAHTTASGLAALALLQSCGLAVVLNTARGVEDARAYCQIYGLPGALAECGSVFVDAAGQREVPLLDPRAVEQLEQCREAVVGLPGVLVDPTYRYAIRAYRVARHGLVAPSAAELAGMLARSGCDRLTFTSTVGEALIMPRDTDKGRGLLAVRSLLDKTGERTAAIGDSDRDIPMLAAADLSYAPANSSSGIRALVHRGRCRLMSEPYQRGLLAAVHDLVSHHADGAGPVTGPRLEPRDLIDELLRVADRSRVRHWLACLRWHTL